MLTEEITQGGACPEMRHSDLFAAFPGLMSAMKPMFVFAYAMTAVCVSGSIPTEYGNGGGVGGVVGAEVGMSGARLIVAIGVALGAVPGAGVRRSSRVRSA